MTSKKALSWDDLADFYGKKTSGTARIKPLDAVYKWAIKQKEIVVNSDSSLSFVPNKQEE